MLKEVEAAEREVKKGHKVEREEDVVDKKEAGEDKGAEAGAAEGDATTTKEDERGEKAGEGSRL